MKTVLIINKYFNKQQIWKACKQSYYWDQDIKPRLYITNVVPCLQIRNNPRTSSRIRKKSFQWTKTIQALKHELYHKKQHWLKGQESSRKWLLAWVFLSSGLNMRSVLCPHLRRPWRRSRVVGAREECEFSLGHGEFKDTYETFEGRWKGRKLDTPSDIRKRGLGLRDQEHHVDGN